jgi:hypothetical protein
MDNDNFDFYKSIKLISLRNILFPTPEYRLRQIFRWYSKTFFTPLHEVPELPLEEILVAYFESVFEDMEEEEINKEKSLLLESEEDKYKRLMEEEQEEISIRKFTTEAAKKDLQKQNKKKKDKIIKTEPEVKPKLINNPEEVRIEFVDTDKMQESMDKPSVGSNEEW